MAVIKPTNVIAEASTRARFEKAGAMVDGDFNGQAAKGAQATDTTNGVLYINTGTKAATVWVKVGTQA